MLKIDWLLIPPLTEVGSAAGKDLTHTHTHTKSVYYFNGGLKEETVLDSSMLILLIWSLLLCEVNGFFSLVILLLKVAAESLMLIYSKSFEKAILRCVDFRPPFPIFHHQEIKTNLQNSVYQCQWVNNFRLLKEEFKMERILQYCLPPFFALFRKDLKHPSNRRLRMKNLTSFFCHLLIQLF